MHLICQVNMYDMPQILPLPRIFNLLTDLREVRDVVGHLHSRADVQNPGRFPGQLEEISTDQSRHA
jgi:hypothetical protein